MVAKMLLHIFGANTNISSALVAFEGSVELTKLIRARTRADTFANGNELRRQALKELNIEDSETTGHLHFYVSLGRDDRIRDTQTKAACAELTRIWDSKTLTVEPDKGAAVGYIMKDGNYVIYPDTEKIRDVFDAKANKWKDEH
ncbi:hypothetical protein SARC_08754 [Sphaeroforma arctica JP610]|uniref:Uncharacterized protein n=1 Tax=Sphaeroforma arctica JP610 TaxID=667725 RepID=A0A0L0FPU9_9EUKA|nr:hypothetical protein SARC_08754 [Sphaeroforma arctica JP610]KNC78827.1 hypothetical protein SARC_08754 [Sphaeroforma arctica JP610]|eukprot:XP_014152729.1 hypothetical protein SARC_08754 [Sphaeroforma arctica JP610]